MAVVAMEGFDHLSSGQLAGSGTNKWSGSVSGVATGRLGVGQCASFVNPQAATKSLPSTYSTLFVGFGYHDNTIAADQWMNFRGGGTNVVGLRLVASGPNKVLRLVNVGGTTLATGTTPILANTWYYVEIRVVISATVGEVELRLNGSVSAELSATGLNTGSTNIDSIQFLEIQGNTHKVDDFYAVDTSGSSPTNTWLGDVTVETLFPNGNGANTAWTGVYTDFDDTTSHDTDTTYISSSTPGDRETATLTDLVHSGTVYAVQANLIARKDDAGVRTIAPVIRISGVNYDGTTAPALGTSYVHYGQVYDRLDPAGAGWTAATVNAMEAGVKEVS